MNKTLFGIVLAVSTTATVGAGGFILKSVNDSRIAYNDTRYVMNSDYKRAEIRRIQAQIDELEWKKTQRNLTPTEQWKLQNLYSQLADAKS